MKKLLIILFLFGSLVVNAATYYVSPSGSDSNPGSLSQPFFTLNKAWSVVSAGDIIYMRGGTYKYGSGFTTFSNKNGSSGNYINIWAYAGESPVIDYSGFVPSGHQATAMTITNCSYVYIKGIRITNLLQKNENDAWPEYGIHVGDNTSNCIFENMETDHIGGTGVVIADGCNNNLFLNFDSHHNADPYSSEPWGAGDGFETGSTTSAGNIFRNCRAWWNSDDGWDLRASDQMNPIEGCWSFWNGYIPDTFNHGGNGEGFKFNGSLVAPTTRIIRRIVNSLAFENYSVGIGGTIGDTYYVGSQVYNNTSYKNGGGIAFNNGAIATVRNNIIYDNATNNNWVDSPSIHDHNSFDLSVTVTNADFLSVNSAGTNGPRQADGSLPNLNFLKLASGSDLSDAGVDVGLAYGGKAPDLGAYEAQSGTTVVTTPSYVSSTVQNTTPSLLEMTYNLTLANIVPTASSFSVIVNSVARAVSTITISGTKVQLTLASAIKFGDVITIAYTKPATNPLQIATGGAAASISAQSTINNLINATKDATPVTMNMTISPNHVHRIINILLGYTGYTSALTTSMTPEIIRITDLTGKLFIEQLIVTGVTSVKIPLNLSSGVYNVLVLANGLQMASQKIKIY